MTQSWYEMLKTTAKEEGLRVQDLLALAPKNDPFYTGRPAELEAAHWFTEIWHRFYGRGQQVHLRRIHYQLVSQDPRVPLPESTVENMRKTNPDYDGTYHNTMSCWRYLNNASKYARYLNLVPPGSFVDRRNKDPLDRNTRWADPNAWGYEDPTPSFAAAGGDEWGYLDLPGLPTLDDIGWSRPPAEPKAKAKGYDQIEQGYHLEVWAEKTTMDDVLIPVCRRLGANLVRGAGELSITMVLDLMHRARAANRPVRIGYVADFDPAGLGMPISVARKIEYFIRAFGFDGLDIRLEPLVLTELQVKQFNLPRTPVKDTDLRKAGFEAAYGVGQVELDALEALHEGQLARIVNEWASQYVDEELESRAQDVKRDLQDRLDEEVADLLDPDNEGPGWLRDEVLMALAETQDDWSGLQQEWDEFANQFQERLDAYKDRVQSIKRWGRLVDDHLLEEIRDLDIDPEDDYPLPDPELPWEGDDQLYDSELEYGDQLVRYKAWRHGL